tara:strand:- start:4450 stop:5181 length:732 start_codon:yes stop_codon:yes gene_type:complete
MAPGALRGEVRLTLQTRQAQRLLEGRPRRPGQPAIRGLMGFADATRDIWRAAQEDDPYADWFLLRIEQRLQHSGRLLQALKSEVLDFAKDSPLDWTAADSSEPARVQLRFATPYAYRGAHLLSDFDRAARLVLTSRHLGILDLEAADAFLNRGGRIVRGAFDSVNGYRRFNIDRDAVMSGSPAARRAQVAMGELPAEVLAEERLADLRPRRLRIENDVQVLDGGALKAADETTSDIPRPDESA